jgi:hypothetical protein
MSIRYRGMGASRPPTRTENRSTEEERKETRGAHGAQGRNGREEEEEGQQEGGGQKTKLPEALQEWAHWTGMTGDRERKGCRQRCQYTAFKSTKHTNKRS